MTGDTVTVSGTSASAVDAAISAAKARGAGTTVVFPAGTYSHATLTWPDNIDLRGAGAGRTVLNFAVRFGSGSSIGDGSEGGGATIGASSTFYLLNGAHGTTFSHIRFRGVWDICDYSGSWGGPVLLSYANAHDIVYSYCEFENSSANTIFNMWWDVRAGGGSLYNFTWDHCTFGVKNAARGRQHRQLRHPAAAIAGRVRQRAGLAPPVAAQTSTSAGALSRTAPAKPP